jgi:hypothetical protein
VSASRAGRFESHDEKSGKVVVVSQHYPPDPSTTAAIVAAISERVAQEAEVGAVGNGEVGN